MYHLHVRSVRKSAGESSAESAAYMTRTGKHKTRGDVIRNTFQLNMPSWVKVSDTLMYWQLADSTISRVNGRSAYLVDFALPRQLSRRAQSKLALGFAREISRLSVTHHANQSLPMLLVIHEGHGKNPHAHLLISTSIRDEWARSPDRWFKRYNAKLPGEGGARRAPLLGRKSWLFKVRELWATMANAFLRRCGFTAMLDHRSYNSASSGRIAQLHLGPSAAHLLAAQRPAPRVLRYKEQMSKRAHLEHQRNNVESALEQVNRSIQAAIDWLQTVQRWQLRSEQEFQALLDEHPLASNAKSTLEHARILVVERGASSNGHLPDPSLDLELRRQLIDLAGHQWHAMMGQGGLYFLRPERDEVVLVGRGYVATDASDEEALRLLMALSSQLPFVQPAVYCDSSLVCDLNHWIHIPGLVREIRELPRQALQNKFQLSSKSREM